MEDEDDNESVYSVSRTGEKTAVGNKTAALKNSRDSGSSSRRDRRRNRRYNQNKTIFFMIFFMQNNAKLLI